MFVKPKKKIPAPLALRDPVVPGRLLPSGQWGINRAAALLNFPDDGLQVVIPVWANKAVGDTVKLLLDGREVDGRPIIDEAELKQPTLLWVAPRHLRTGSYQLTYEIKQFGHNDERPDTPLNLYVKLELPAGQDIDPNPGSHSNLFMYIPPEIVNGGVDKDVAEAGVPIVIRSESGSGLPYPDIAEGDVIHLSWGGFFEYSTPVTQAQINDPAANPILITVSKATIERAGDTDLSGLAVTFKVRDIVGNESEDWCKETRIVVTTGIDLLAAPIVQEAVNNKLDADKQGDNDITVHVTATRPDFEMDDIIHLTMLGTTLEGEKVEVTALPQTVDNIPHNYEFKLPIADVRKLVNTQVSFFYRLERSGSSDPLRSKGQFVHVTGAAHRLAAPIIEEAEGDFIDPTKTPINVRIPFDPAIEYGMGIELFLLGKRPDGSTFLPELEWHIPEEDEVENPEGFVITVADYNLKLLDGGTLEGWYELLIADGDEILRRESLHTKLINVGEPKFELDAPIVLGVANGFLDPATLPGGTSKLTIPRPVVKPWVANDEANWKWVGDISGVETRSRTFNAVTAQQDWVINLDAAFVAQYIEPNRDNKITVNYHVWRSVTDETSYSNPLKFTVGQAQEQLLEPAKVREAVNDVLDPASVPVEATVLIAANRAENAGDHYYMNWRTADGSVDQDYDKPISGNNKGKEVEFPVPRQIVLDSLNHTVTLSYYVELFEGGTSLGSDYELRVEAAPGVKLPVATFLEASGPQKDQINPNDVFPLGATVVIAASAALRTDDEIHVVVIGKTTFRKSHTVLANQADKELAVIKVDHTFIDDNVDDSISMTYTITRKAGGTDGPSDPTVYDVRKVIGSGALKVMGARFNRSTYRSSGASHVLSAFNASTGQPLQAQWKYPDDSQWTTASTWYDTRPHLPLQVRTTDDALTLNPANIFGNGNDLTLTGQSAYVAHRNVGDVVGWGNGAYGATIPSTIITMDDIVEVSCTRSAYAARRANNAVVVWGTVTEGGSMGGVSPLGFKQVVGNAVAFAGVKLTGQVVAWGDADNGGSVPDDIGQHDDIEHVVSAGQAFAALRTTGEVVAWGLAANGGTVPGDIAGFDDIKTLIGSNGAFAAHRANGRIVGWGHAGYGGAVPEAIALLDDIIELSCANAQAFAARRASGHVVAWGTAEYGGTIDSLIGGLDDIVEVSSTWRAFAARRSNGHVVAWGRPAEGGAVPSEIAILDDIVQVCGSSQAFAALCRNGTVVAWGDQTVGGDTAPVVDQLTNVVALYSNTTSFTALTSDGRVVTWGVAAGGGDSSAVQELLRGKFSYLATPATRGLALKASRRALLDTPR